MRLKPIGSNKTELVFTNEEKEVTFLFSYETPVAGFTTKELPGHSGGFFRTNIKYSVTTSKHINRYIDGRNATFIDQQSINSLIK